MQKTDEMDPMRPFDADQLLAEAAAMSPPPLDAGFMARVMADAQNSQPRAPGFVRAASVQPAPAPRGFGRGGMIEALADVFGGRGALAAMMLATVTGLYVGVAQPSLLGSLTGLSSESPIESLDLMSGGDTLWTEATP